MDLRGFGNEKFDETLKIVLRMKTNINFSLKKSFNTWKCLHFYERNEKKSHNELFESFHVEIFCEYKLLQKLQ